MGVPPQGPSGFQPGSQGQPGPGWAPADPYDPYQQSGAAPLGTGWSIAAPTSPYQQVPVQPNPYQQQPVAVATSAPRQKTPRTGEIGLLLSALALIVSMALTAFTVATWRDLYLTFGPDWAESEIPAQSEALIRRLSGLLLGQLVPTILGIAGLVTGAVGLKWERQRGYGIAAIILAILAPLASFLLLVMLVQPYLP